TVAFGEDNGNIELADINTGENRRSLFGHRKGVNGLAFSSDSRVLASASEDGTLRLWHVSTGQELCVLEDRRCPMRAVAFSNDGRFLVVAGEHPRIGSSISVYDSREKDGPAAGRADATGSP